MDIVFYADPEAVNTLAVIVAICTAGILSGLLLAVIALRDIVRSHRRPYRPGPGRTIRPRHR
jgi:hypothetical protein